MNYMKILNCLNKIYCMLKILLFNLRIIKFWRMKMNLIDKKHSLIINFNFK